MTTTFDVIVLGAGMAGASLAAELVPRCRVLLLETEDQPGRHATGRSAAMFFESYGNPTVRALTRASRAFLERPPAGFTDAALLAPRSALFVADAPRADRFGPRLESPGLRRIGVDAALALCPILRREWVAAAALDETGQDIDVAALHQAYLRAARRGGAQVVTDAAETTLQRRGGVWTVRSRAGSFEAPVVANATGAWADAVARQAGARELGLRPLRRSVVTLPAPPDMRGWPLVIDVDEQFYFKPDAGQILLSPANEDPMPPCDVVPEELDIAIAVDRFEQATTWPVTRINRRWAGLRSFVADRSPVAGYDDGIDGFFWLAGQGGYGIQMAPALARVAAALLLQRNLPDDVRAQGVAAGDVAPGRVMNAVG